jgi:RNA polymerase sigma factor (sigma-70 family)
MFMSDSELLERYVRDRDQAAFAELTRRHLDLVFAAARRHLNGDTHLAEDVTQQVFVDLATKARSLVGHPCLTGWLYGATRFAALNTVRQEQRRVTREQTASMHTTHSPDWERVRPLIDDALATLEERDRQFVLLRFFEQCPLGAIAEQFSVTENTVQKAIARAGDVLSAELTRRGVASTAAALALVLEQVAEAAPANLASRVADAVTAAQPVVTTISSSLGLAKLIAAIVGTATIAIFVAYPFRSRQRIDRAPPAHATPASSPLTIPPRPVHSLAKPLATTPVLQSAQSSIPPAANPPREESSAERRLRLKPLLAAGQPIKGAIIGFAGGKLTHRDVAFVMGKETRVEDMDEGTWVIMPTLKDDGTVRYAFALVRRHPDGSAERKEDFIGVVTNPWLGFTLHSQTDVILAFDPDEL